MSVGRIGRVLDGAGQGIGWGGQRCSGQSTVEFAIVTVAVIGVIVGLSALWHLAGDGVLAEHAVAAASHHVAGALSAAADVFAY